MVNVIYHIIQWLVQILSHISQQGVSTLSFVTVG